MTPLHTVSTAATDDQTFRPHCDWDELADNLADTARKVQAAKRLLKHANGPTKAGIVAQTIFNLELTASLCEQLQVNIDFYTQSLEEVSELSKEVREE